MRKPKQSGRIPKKPEDWTKKAPESLDEWKSYANSVMTHSIKLVHTNARAGGVRVIPVKDSEIPYACVRFSSPVPLDCTPGASALSYTKRIFAVHEHDFSEFVNVDWAQVEQIKREVCPLLDRYAVLGGDPVSPRVRQIIVEDENGADLCLTPLPSAGLSAKIRKIEDDLLRKHKSADKKNTRGLRYDTAWVPIGGEKAQNAMRPLLMRAMRHAWRFRTPGRIDPQMRHAFSLHHRGVSLVPPKELIIEYGQWADRVIAEKSAPNTMRNREKEGEHIRAMVEAVLKRGAWARQRIAPFLGNPIPELTAEHISLAVRGTIDPSLRTDEWQEDFSKSVANNIAIAKGRDGVPYSNRSRQAIPAIAGAILSIVSNPEIKETLS